MLSEWWKPRTPLGIIAQPWLADEAIQYLETLVQPDDIVLEFGAGGSTLWFAHHAKLVISFENNPKWLKRVKELAPRNVVLIERDEYKGNILPDISEYDILFIDGDPVILRGEWLKSARSLVKSGGLVVLDNSNRPEFAEERAEFAKHAHLLKRFDNNINCKQIISHYFVTEFWKLCE
jgi:predicted O-methyltransferase YrrM